METKAFSFNSQAKCKADGHFKEKAGPLPLANQEIMVDDKGVTLRPCSRTSSPTIRTLRLLETLQWQTRHGKYGKPLPSAGGSASLTSPSCAPLPVVGFHLRTTSKRRSTPFLPACTTSTSTLRTGVCLKSCVSPSQGINLIHGTRMHMTPEPISGFVLSSPFLRNKTGGRRWTTNVKASALGVTS